MLWQVINSCLQFRLLRVYESFRIFWTHQPVLNYENQPGMAYPLKLGERRVSFWLQCFGPQDIPVSLAGALEAGLLKGCPDCIVGNASILHSH